MSTAQTDFDLTACQSDRNVKKCHLHGSFALDPGGGFFCLRKGRDEGVSRRRGVSNTLNPRCDALPIDAARSDIAVLELHLALDHELFQRFEPVGGHGGFLIIAEFLLPDIRAPLGRRSAAGVEPVFMVGQV